MLTDQQKTAFRRESFHLIQKLDSKTKKLPLNEWVTIRPTKYGWRNAYRYGIVTNELSSLIDRNWLGGCYGTGGIDGGIYYLFTGNALAFIINVPELEHPNVTINSIYDTVDLSAFLDTPFTDKEIRSYINSSIIIVDDYLKNKSSLFNMIYDDEQTNESFTSKQKTFHAILSSYLIPMFCHLDSSFNPIEKLIKTEFYLQYSPISNGDSRSLMNKIIYSLTSNYEIFPFLKENSDIFKGFTLIDSANATIN